MYFYSLGWGSYEESDYRTFYSNKKLTKKDLVDIAIAASKDYLEAKPEDITEEYFVHTGDLLSSIPSSFYEKYGLYSLEITEQHSFWGWNDLGHKDGDLHYWENDSDEEDLKYVTAIKDKVQELIDKGGK